MTDAETYNNIYHRIKDEDLPENPVEFQRLIHNLSDGQELIGPSFGEINNYGDVGYADLDLLLKNYCSSCNLEGSCGWNSQVRRAAGDNYPFWLLTWPIVNFPLSKDEPCFMNGNTVMCTHYQSEEFEKEGIEIVQQPLTRLTQIIEKEIERRE